MAFPDILKVLSLTVSYNIFIQPIYAAAANHFPTCLHRQCRIWDCTIHPFRSVLFNN